MKSALKKTTNRTGLMAILMIGISGHAFAQGAPVQEVKDRATGATVSVFRTATGPRLEIVSPTVSLTKQVGAGGVVVTTLRDSKESLRIEAREGAIAVSGSRGNVIAAAGDKVAAERAREVIARSPLTKRAATLIGKMGFGDASPIQPMLLTTRAFLLAASNDQSGLRDLMDWMKNTRTGQKVTRTALPMDDEVMDKTPSQCWFDYTQELLNAFDEFYDCFMNIKWWDPFFPVERCEVVYEVRILGAFGWWLHCLGLVEPEGNK